MRNLGFLTINKQLKSKLDVDIDEMCKKHIVQEVVENDFEVQQMKKRIIELEKKPKDA